MSTLTAPVKGVDQSIEWRGVTVKIEQLTSGFCGESLKHNKVKRLLKQNKIDQMKRDMRCGQFEFNGAPIIFDEDGVLMDGHHRFTASRDTGRSFWAIVIRGVKNEVRHTIDTGTSRSLSDCLKFAGYGGNSRHLAGLIGLLWRYKSTGLTASSFRQTPAASELLSLAHRHSDIVDSITFVRARCDRLYTVWALLHFLCKHDTEADVEDFITKCNSGVGLREGDPCLQLAKTMANWDRLAAKRQPVHQQKKLALVVKAWNAYRTGDLIGGLRWAASGKNPEPFPEIAGAMPTEDI